MTFKEAYDMSSLEVSPDGEQLMYKAYGDHDQLVLHSLDDGGEEIIVPDGNFASGAPIISTPTISPDGKSIVFSDVAAKDEKGTFIYEAFHMNLDTKQAEQLTNFHENVTSPVYFHSEDKLIVTVDKNFAGAEPDYSYWIIGADGETQNRVAIEVPEESSPS